MKKILSIVLVIAMVFSSMSFAFASTFEDVKTDSKYDEAISVLVGLGVINGYEDGTFRPERTVTRAEMAKLLVITLGYGDLVSGSKSNFSDTQGHWADSYIGLAAGKGLVVGTGDGKFSPDKTVSYDEVLTMIVRGLGYTDDCNELKSMTWPTKFKVKAAELGITDDVVMNSDGADRGGVAQAIFNALECTLVTINKDGDVQNIIDGKNKNKELLSRLAILNEDYNVTPGVVDKNSDIYAGDIVDLEPYMYENLKVYVNKNDEDEVVYVKESNSLVVKGSVDEVTDTAKGAINIEKEDGKIAKVIIGTDKNAEPDMYYNGADVKFEFTDKIDYEDFETIKVVADDKNNNGKIDKDETIGVVVEKQTQVARIEKEYIDGKLKLDVFYLPENANDEVEMDNVKVTGAVSSLKDIKIDDVVVEYKSDNDNDEDTKLKLVVSRNVVEGKVTRIDDTDFYIDGKCYSLSETKGSIEAHEIDLGDKGKFYLDHKGDLVDFDGESQGPTDYAVVIGSSNGKVEDKFGDFSIDDYPELKLATQDDEEIVYEVDVKLKTKDKKGTVDRSADITNINGKKDDLFTDGDVEFKDGGKIDIEKTLVKNQKYLIKYNLNKDGRIDDIEIIHENVEYSVDNKSYKSFDTQSASFKLENNVVVFDADKDFEVVNSDKLKSDITAVAVYDEDTGKIEVLVVGKGGVKANNNVTFAYVTNVNKAYDKHDDEVQLITSYMNGEKLDRYTDDNKLVDNKGYFAVYGLEFDGDTITEATKVTGTMKTKDIEVEVYEAVTASAISAKNGRIQLSGHSNWISLADNATIIGVELVKGKFDDVNDIRDLYDIEKDETVMNVYVNDDDEIELIIIYENKDGKQVDSSGALIK